MNLLFKSLFIAFVYFTIWLAGRFFIKGLAAKLKEAPDADPDVPMPAADKVRNEYHWLLMRIGMAKIEELDSLKGLAEDFETRNKPHAWVGDMFIDLLKEINDRHTHLVLKKAMAGVRM